MKALTGVIVLIALVVAAARPAAAHCICFHSPCPCASASFCRVPANICPIEISPDLLLDLVR